MIERTAIWVICVFAIIYWFQCIDDKRNGVKRSTTNRLKFPALVSILVGITISLYDINLSSPFYRQQEIFTEQAGF